MDKSAKLINFSGYVQGVGFRYTASRIAKRYDLTGYVKNLSNGDVEMLLQGPQDDIQDCLEDIADSFSSNIRNRDIKDVSADGRYSDFEIAF